jgi:hypothetical protein
MKTILCIVLLLVEGISPLELLNQFPLVLPSTSTPKTSTCSDKYGNQPAKRSASINGLLSNLNWCIEKAERVNNIKFTDKNGEQRQACLFITPSIKPLPLLVWLHASLLSPSSIVLTNLINEAGTADLTGIKYGPIGYHLLVPLGRDTTHIYPPPDDQGLGWDNWYRNYNRSDPSLNVDVQTIDYFIDYVLNHRSDFKVDSSRVFMSGWSNGAAMALQYALNTPRIAAAAVYSAPDPYRDYKDPCSQTPKPTYFTPVLTLYNQCDVIGICQTGKAFIDDLNNRYANKLTAKVVIIDSFFQIKTTCHLNCNSILGLGLIQHLRWPINLNDKVFFNFFRQHSSI